MSLLECMQHGTPAVVSDIPPHRELLGSVAGYDLSIPQPTCELSRRRSRLRWQNRENTAASPKVAAASVKDASLAGDRGTYGSRPVQCP